jgi:crotonobetainyl-CoA:carnitine CoA-transferase CaiB-like acyl-CoA transferase
LVAALQAPDLLGDERFKTRLLRIKNYEALTGELDQRFCKAALAVWVERLGQNDVPFAPIHTIDEVVQDPQVQHLGLIVPAVSEQVASRAVRPAVQFAGAQSSAVRAAPHLNQDGKSIRDSLAKGARWPTTAA